mgnify:CR=1 FL=1
MNLVGKRKIWFLISLIAIVPGTISLFLFGLRPGIDFTGGSLIEVYSVKDKSDLTSKVEQLNLPNLTVTPSGDGQLLLRYRDTEQSSEERLKLQDQLKSLVRENGATVNRVENVGPSISADITKNALWSVFLASLAIVFYISFAFRSVPKPASSWRFGMTAIAALLHDSLFLLGVFSLLGRFFSVEVDSLFVTAVLTVIGFSVHDTIVVFDRIRENLRRERKSFEEVVNDSLNETFARSINTSLTVIFTLTALYIFGGESIKNFVLALLIGIIAGTYSSLFNASQLLVVWQNRADKKAT